MEMTQDEIPEIKPKRGNGKVYGPIVDKIMELPQGQSLKMACKDPQERGRFMHALAEHRRKRQLGFKVYREGETIWAWNPEK